MGILGLLLVVHVVVVAAFVAVHALHARLAPVAPPSPYAGDGSPPLLTGERLEEYVQGGLDDLRLLLVEAARRRE